MEFRSQIIMTLLLSTLFTGQFFAQNNNPQSPQIAIKLELGKTISIDNTDLTFTELREDSRCPKYTTCVWAGRARVIVGVQEEGQSLKEFMIFIGEVMPDESPNKTLIDTDAYSVEVEQLKPYPGDDTHKETTPTLLLLKKEKGN